MPTMPMFPLGSVLFPKMPLPLRIFEPRYLAMLGSILAEEPSEFGVVLIERGHEVGGNDQRMGIGTVAQIVELDTSAEAVLVVAMGDRRFEVTSWHPDDPFPRAEVEPLPELEWSDDMKPLFERADGVVRRALARATEWGEGRWPADVELADDPVSAAWQLAAVAPLGPLDQVALLRATSVEQLLHRTIDLVTAVQALY
jgi:Lon protease-like protein